MVSYRLIRDGNIISYKYFVDNNGYKLDKYNRFIIRFNNIKENYKYNIKEIIELFNSVVLGNTLEPILWDLIIVINHRYYCNTYNDNKIDKKFYLLNNDNPTYDDIDRLNIIINSNQCNTDGIYINDCGEFYKLYIFEFTN